MRDSNDCEGPGEGNRKEKKDKRQKKGCSRPIFPPT